MAPTRWQSRLGWRPRTTALAVCMAVYFASRFGQAALSTLGPRIAASLDVTMALFGLAFTGLSLLSALVQLPSGALSDRYGERAVLVAAVALVGSSTVALAAAPTYFAFLPLMVLVGVGSGLYYSPSTALLDRRYDRLGGAIGTYRVSGQLAGVAAPVVAGALAVRYGWRVALLAAGLLLAPALVGVVGLLEPTPPNAPGRAFRDAVAAERLAGVLSRPGVAGTTALAALVQFVDVASFTFLPAILQQYHDLSTAAAGSVYALYFAVVAAVQPASGWLSDRLGRDPVTGATLVAGVAGYGLLTQRVPGPVLVAAVVLAGASMTWATPVQARIVDALGEDERGVGFGFVRTAYLLVGALGGYVVGALATAAGWAVAFGALAGLLAVCLFGLVAAAATRVRRR